MSVRSAVLFLEDGKGSPFLFSQWRDKGPLIPIQAREVLVVRGYPTKYLAGLWRAAFPIRQALPTQPIANPDGTGTDAFWEVFK